MNRVLRLQGPRQIRLEESELRPPGKGEILLKSLMSGISHGTEMNLYRGNSPFATKNFDRALRMFTPREKQTEAYPISLGYELIARVVEVGPDVSGFDIGDHVHTATPHQEFTVVHVEGSSRGPLPLMKLPPGLEPEKALFISLGGVALQAVHDACIKLGDSVAVFGAGTVGLLTAQMAYRNGARTIIVADPIAERRAMAGKIGATHVLDPFNEDVGLEVRRITNGPGVDTAIETSGNYNALHDAVRSVGMGGRIVTVGYYQGGATALNLGEEWHHNRPTMVSSMGVWECPHRAHPQWNRNRITKSVLELIGDETVTVDGFVSHRIAFSEAAGAYHLIDTEPDATIKVILTYD